MAKIRVRGLGRLLLIVVTVVLALSLGAEAVYGEHASAAPAMNGAGRTAPSAPTPGRPTPRPRSIRNPAVTAARRAATGVPPPR